MTERHSNEPSHEEPEHDDRREAASAATPRDDGVREPLGARLLAARQDSGTTGVSQPPGRKRGVPGRGHDGSAFAVVAFIFSLLGLCPAFLPMPAIAVVLGHVARRRQLRGPRPVRGGTLALSALVVGYSLIALYTIVAAILGTVILMAQNDKQHLGRCHENMDNLVRAVHQYSRGHGGRLPESVEDLRPYFQDLDALLHCPADPRAGAASYEIVLTGFMDDQMRPESTVLIRETGRHHLFGRRVVCYLDGRTEVIRR